MTGTEIRADLILSTLGLTIGLAMAAIAIVGAVYLLARPMAEAGFGPSKHPTQPRPRRLVLEADELWLAAAASRRAVGVAVALVALVAASPWLHDPIERLSDRWRDGANTDRTWAYLALAAAVWLGMLPLALFLWRLPRRTWDRRTTRWASWASRLGMSTSPGLPHAIIPGDLGDAPPYHAALRHTCHLYGINAALWAGAGRRGTADRPTPIAAIVVVPAVGAVALAGFLQPWIALGAFAIIAVLSITVGLRARSDALRAPGTAALDYLLLVSAARDGRSREARIGAEAYLTQNPATLQDHAGLVAVLAGARWIDEPAWDPVPATQPDVVVPATMAAINRNGSEALLQIAIRLVYGEDRRWRVARVWSEQIVETEAVRARSVTPVPIAWA